MGQVQIQKVLPKFSPPPQEKQPEGQVAGRPRPDPGSTRAHIPVRETGVRRVFGSLGSYRTQVIASDWTSGGPTLINPLRLTGATHSVAREETAVPANFALSGGNKFGGISEEKHNFVSTNQR